MGLRVKTKTLFLVSLSSLILAGCSVETSAEPYQSIGSFNSATGTSSQTPPVATEAIRPPFTLEQCIDIALKNNPQIAQRKCDIEASLAEKDIAKGHLWPSISDLLRYPFQLKMLQYRI